MIIVTFLQAPPAMWSAPPTVEMKLGIYYIITSILSKIIDYKSVDSVKSNHAYNFLICVMGMAALVLCIFAANAVMKKRYIYTILFGVPGFLISLLISFAVFGAAAGFSWIFLFGDEGWPDSVSIVLPLILGVVFILVWGSFLVSGFRFGKRRENFEGVNRRHIMVSTGITLLFIGVIVLHQFSVGNLGPASVGEQCTDRCSERGFHGSMTPPRDSGEKTCMCFDTAASEWISIE